MYTHMHIKPYFKVLHLWVIVQLRKEETEVFNQLWACSNTQINHSTHGAPWQHSASPICVQTPKTTLFVFTHKEIIFALLPSKAHLLKSKGRHHSVLTREDISKTASESQQLRELDSDPLNPVWDIVQMWGRLEWKGKCTLCYICISRALLAWRCLGCSHHFGLSLAVLCGSFSLTELSWTGNPAGCRSSGLQHSF